MDSQQPHDLYQFYMAGLGDEANETLAAEMASRSRIVTKEKGEVIFSPDIGCSSTFFLLDGVMKTYIVSPDGTENTFAIFFKPGTCYTMNEETIKTTELMCKAITPCTLIELSPGLFDLAEEFPELWKMLVLGWRPFYYGMMDKLRAGYTLTAKERYLWFVERYGPVLDKLSQNEIAQYLGILPQSLSRIRSELAEGGVQS